MAQLNEHLDRLREKPEHVRNRIALFTSAGLTAVVALLWGTAMATSGTLALDTEPAQPNPLDESVKESLAESKTAFSELMGAVGTAVGATSTDPSLKVVESETTSTFDTKIGNDTEKTIIPF